MDNLAVKEIFQRLQQSSFRARFKLNAKDATYLQQRGLPVIMEHGASFIEKRLAPAVPKNDGKQTPWRGHPIFVAQHAMACCCRSCLEKWHHIPKNKLLSSEEQAYILQLLQYWLIDQERKNTPKDEAHSLFGK